MGLAAFDWTSRARPIVEIGVGDTRIPLGSAVWDVARWDQPGATWSGDEPTWIDVTCDVRTFRCEYGRQRSIDRYVPGVAQVVVDNASGWADPNTAVVPNVLTMRPGRAIRMGVEHELYGRCWLFRGFIDAMTPSYVPADDDTVQFDCLDALGEVNRAKLVPVEPPQHAGQTVDQRITTLLDLAKWPPSKRDIDPASDTLLASNMGGQMADLLGQAAESNGGSLFGDLNGDVAYRGRDWQMFVPGTPVDGTIGNVEAADVCPVSWQRPFARRDLATRVIIGRDLITALQLDDDVAQLRYGIEPFERVDLLTASDDTLALLGRRILATRSAEAAPRVRAVTLDARTSDAALDLMATVDVYRPSRYRCRLTYPDRGLVFDAEHFATGVVHEVTEFWWSLQLNLDLAAPYEAGAARWDENLGWDRSTWAAPV